MFNIFQFHRAIFLTNFQKRGEFLMRYEETKIIVLIREGKRGGAVRSSLVLIVNTHRWSNCRC